MATQKLDPGFGENEQPSHSPSLGEQEAHDVLSHGPASDRRSVLQELDDSDYDRQITEEEM